MCYAEVLYYFFVQKHDLQYTLAAIKIYSSPDDKILKEICMHLGEVFTLPLVFCVDPCGILQNSLIPGHHFFGVLFHTE
jgi:hypothetical protein